MRLFWSFSNTVIWWRQLCCVFKRYIFLPILQAICATSAKQNFSVLFSIVFCLLCTSRNKGSDIRYIVLALERFMRHDNVALQIRNQNECRTVRFYREPIIINYKTGLEKTKMFFSTVVFIQSVVKVNTRSNEGLQCRVSRVW